MSQASSDTPSSNGGGAGPLILVLPIVLVAALGFVAWKYLASEKPENNSQEEQVEAPADSETNTTLSQTFVGINNAIDSIFDEQTAQQAADKISELTKIVEGLNLDQLKGGQRVYTQALVPRLKRGVESRLEEVYDLPGIKPILEPAVQRLMEQLDKI